MNKLYKYIFHYNSESSKPHWAAIPRDKYNEYMNNMNERVNSGIIFSENVNDLINFITKEK